MKVFPFKKKDQYSRKNSSGIQINQRYSHILGFAQKNEKLKRLFLLKEILMRHCFTRYCVTSDIFCACLMKFINK